MTSIRFGGLGPATFGLALAAALSACSTIASQPNGASAAAAGIEKRIDLSQAAGGAVRWILPGPRRLDPRVFGTPANPLGFESDVGVPVAARGVSEDGKAFTTTKAPTPHGDASRPITGSYRATLVDATRLDAKSSQDSATGEFTFTDPSGNNRYRVVIVKPLPVGPVHQFFGGVLTNGFLHGTTSFGTRMQPSSYTYGAIWAMVEFYVNGEKVAGNRMMHLMATERVRSPVADGYRLLIDSELPHKGIETHLLLPNIVLTPQGPQTKPLPSGFVLPNGAEQPFIHIMFDDTEIEGLPVL